jgi:antitoxin (DNA-binding transcriptional repressor) of toxin-antitoxin stability system
VYARQSDSAAVQTQIAEAAIKIDTARLHTHAAADKLDAAARAPTIIDYAAQFMSAVRSTSRPAARFSTVSAAILADVERTGETVIITNHGRDVARLVPATPTQFGQLPNLLIPKDFDEPLSDAELARWEGEESS